jgi:hypothetical protein
MSFYLVLACAVISLHTIFILWIIFGAILTQRRPRLRSLHIASIVWGVLIELVPWPCPLTIAENWLEIRAGRTGYQAGFLLHYLHAFVYPNLPPQLLTIAAVLVGLINLAIYVARQHRRTSSGW